MDSLTQLTLGAAVGEAVLGKKVGNRAMLWGAFGGLLPDFDVFAMLFTDEMTALAFHRGFTHSILFSIIAAFLLGWLTERLYRTDTYRKRWYKAIVALFILSIYTLLLLGIHMILRSAVETPGVIIAGVVGGLLLGWMLWTKYISRKLKDVQATRKDWTWLFFLSIFTHPILDCFTVYGTQLFLPFSNYRVSWDNISVADPAYTLPLMLGVLTASFISRTKNARRVANWAGIAISSAYMLFTFYHKASFNEIFERSMASEGIEYNRYMSGPAILNNFLWLGVAETDEGYYHGYYSFFDPEPKIKKFNYLEKNHELIEDIDHEREIEIIKWFSKGYYNVITRKDGDLQINDLRYGSFEEDLKEENDYIFKFIIEEKQPELVVRQSREGREIDKDALKKYFNRVRGIHASSD